MARHVNIPVFIPNLGCPYKCVFCDQREISGSKFSLSDVRETISKALSTVEPDAEREIAFFGGSFTGIGDRLMTSLLDIAQEFISGGTVGSIRLSTRPDMIDGHILGILSRYSVRTIELGIQSVDDRVLSASNRGHAAAVSYEACRMVREYGFDLVGQMMIGLPESTPASERETAEMICRSGAVGARIYPAVVLRGTEMERMAGAGKYSPVTVEDAVSRSADLIEIFDSHGVAVLRVGLCASDGLSEGDAVGGAYHPALGEMARGEVFRRRIDERLEVLGAHGASRAEVFVPKGAVSAAIGQRRANAEALRSKFNINTLKIIENPQLIGYNIDVSLSAQEK
ncbi:MAG: radical SAM protein [Clostridia bacterium]|nr:radical SAM protein [Clostridia bacterium]